ncbi:uncharacterized protein LOC128216959 [Mya arenaria]|uniref:uncharacterized protein LOC128216959 n=1 Tax=Mya arenaria TaxID=6604 RepID=UPI0022E54301|nr:uncharacterized protein LOC128216959 [Mya arenaria]
MWNDIEQTERDSFHLYELCCEVGVSAEDIKNRNWLSDYTNSLFSLEGIANYGSDVDFMFHAINVGSNAEGIGLEKLGSDYNVMMTLSGTRIAPQRQSDTHSSDVHLFKVVQTYHPSYVRLQCVLMGTSSSRSIMSTPSCCVADEQGRMILAPKLLMDSYSRNGTGTISAPGVSGVLRSSVKPILCVHSPVWPIAAREWAFRVRRFIWPTVELKKFILQHGCHVVPHGNSESPNKHLEWRWSFSLAEKLLIRTFNTTQIQCFFLLKLLVTYVINPAVIETISSYHVKTVMLHMVESTHPTEWTKDKLSSCFVGCLQKLLQCLEDGTLPHYFIPSHNLFHPKLQGDSRIRLVSIVTGQLEKGWQCLLQCLPPNMNMLLARHKIQVRCDCYDTHWGSEGCERNVSMVERCYTLFNAAIRVILRLTERQDLQSTIDAMTMFIEYPTMRDPVHFPDVPTTGIMKLMIKSHLGIVYLGLSKSYPYNRKGGSQTILPTGQKFIEGAIGVDAATTKLKLATFHYMTENYDETIKITMQLLRQFNEYIVNTTGDKTRRMKSSKRQKALRKHRSVTSLIGNAPSMMEWAALELTFGPWEVPFAPEAIQMLKDREAMTDDDTDHRGFVFVDAIVYAYFLLALSYNSIHRPVHRQQAIDNLQLLVKGEENNDIHYPEVARFLLPYVKERKHKNCMLCHVRTF